MSLLGKLKSAVMGNPVMREYEVGRHIASAGPGMLWKVYAATKKATGEEAAVFIFDKQSQGFEKRPKKEREALCELMRKGPAQLVKLRHPNLLVIEHSVEETSNCIAFATEPIFASLANLLGNYDNLPTPLPLPIKEHEFYLVELQYGLLQVIQALEFLHLGARLLHGNLTPGSVVVNRGGAWKLMGFNFCCFSQYVSESHTSFKFREWDTKTKSTVGNPSLDYLAPEYVISKTCNEMSDVFSYGMLAYTVYNKGKPLFPNNNNLLTFKQNVEQVSRITERMLGDVPMEFKPLVRGMLAIEPSVRPDATQITKLPFFDEVAVSTLRYLDDLFQKSELERSQYYKKSLSQVLNKLPRRVVHQRVLPILKLEFRNNLMIPFVLPLVLIVAEDCSIQEYGDVIMPILVPVFQIQEPMQVPLIILQKMELVLSKTSPKDMKDHVLPMILSSMEAPNHQVQELCVSVLPTFASMIDYGAMKHSIIPRLTHLCLSSKSVSLCVKCLVSIGKMLDALDKHIVVDQLFPVLEQIQSREPGILMAMLGIYHQTMVNKKMGLDKLTMSTRVLPFLLPLTTEPTLRLPQFKQFMLVIREMLNKLEAEQTTHLEQLSKMEEQTKSTVEFARELSEAKATEDSLSSLEKMVMAGGGSSPMVPHTTTTVGRGGGTGGGGGGGGGAKAEELLSSGWSLQTASGSAFNKPSPSPPPPAPSQRSPSTKPPTTSSSSAYVPPPFHSEPPPLAGRSDPGSSLELDIFAGTGSSTTTTLSSTGGGLSANILQPSVGSATKPEAMQVSSSGSSTAPRQNTSVASTISTSSSVPLNQMFESNATSQTATSGVSTRSGFQPGVGTQMKQQLPPSRGILQTPLEPSHGMVFQSSSGPHNKGGILQTPLQPNMTPQPSFHQPLEPTRPHDSGSWGGGMAMGSPQVDRSKGGLSSGPQDPGNWGGGGLPSSQQSVGLGGQSSRGGILPNPPPPPTHGHGQAQHYLLPTPGSEPLALLQPTSSGVVGDQNNPPIGGSGMEWSPSIQPQQPQQAPQAHHAAQSQGGGGGGMALGHGNLGTGQSSYSSSVGMGWSSNISALGQHQQVVGHPDPMPAHPHGPAPPHVMSQQYQHGSGSGGAGGGGIGTGSSGMGLEWSSVDQLQAPLASGMSTQQQHHQQQHQQPMNFQQMTQQPMSSNLQQPMSANFQQPMNANFQQSMSRPNFQQQPTNTNFQQPMDMNFQQPTLLPTTGMPPLGPATGMRPPATAPGHGNVGMRPNVGPPPHGLGMGQRGPAPGTNPFADLEFFN